MKNAIKAIVVKSIEVKKAGKKYYAINIKLPIKYLLLPYLLVMFLMACSVTDKLDSAKKQINKASAAKARLILGLAYLEQGQLPLASRNLNRALSYAPQNYQVHLAIARYEQQAGQYDKAQLAYQQALTLAPKQSDLLTNYGKFLCDLGQYELANYQFELALNQTNYDTIAELLENAGYCYLKQKRYPQAKEFLNRALHYAPVKSKNLLLTTEDYLKARQVEQVAVLLEIYQQNLPTTAESLWLQLRFAALTGELAQVNDFGQQLAKNFSQSKQYKQFLTHEY